MARRLIFFDGDNNVIGTLEVVDGKPIATGEAKDALDVKVAEPNTFKQLFPSDGDRWLSALRYEFRGPYFTCSFEEDARAAGLISKNGTVAQKADMSKNAPVLTLHKPADQDLVGHATGTVRSRWLRESGSLVEPREWLDELATNDVDSIITQVEAKWDIVYTACRPLLLDVVNDTVQRGMLSMADDTPSVQHLKAVGAEWLDAFGKTMLVRWVGDRIRRAVLSSKTLEDQSLAVVRAVESVPDAFALVMQPLVRRLLAFGAILQELERAAPHVTVHKARETQRYVIVTANDDRVCTVCEYLGEVGPFRLADALDLFDNFVEAVEEDDFTDELQSGPWLTDQDIADKPTRTDFKAVGQIIPPFHPECRCGVAFVR